MIRIKKLDLKNVSAASIVSLAKAYIKVFSTDPSWNEFWKCPKCESVFSKDCTDTECSHCKMKGYSVPLVDYWTLNNVLSDFYKEMSKDHAVCFIAVDENEEIVGFCWGYFLRIDEDLEDHLKAPDLVSSLQKDGIKDEYVAYQDEIAVVPNFQRQGIAKQLFTERHRHFHSIAPNGTVIFRTLLQPPSITYQWMVGKLGYKVIHEINSENRIRIIASAPIASLINI